MVHPMAQTLEKQETDRVAFDFDEFAKKFGRDRSWTYRQVRAGRIKVISGYGKMMIPASEVERILEGKEAAR